MKKEKWKVLLWIGTALILGLGIHACSNLDFSRTLPEREPGVRPSTPTSYQFGDIPLPPGMTLIRRESFVYETKATKAGLLVYEGKGEMEKLANFFKQQMPNYQWRMVWNFELSNVMLIFIKEGWASAIYIFSQQEEEERKRIEIRVGPIEMKYLSSMKERTN